MAIATINVMIKNVQFIGSASVRCKTKSPTQLVNGPGKTGKKLPSIPRSINKPLIINKNISIKSI
ncbi:hypothetical protein GCM10009431_06840 [Gaetbulibacter jejuensis]|uniref:Uncharacterized protein n=1 Tax=Gaetbulibacter jejuensis TaxID=584607 RepID=A0ABN1JFP4_9FLAO